jgi:hypothetical protein
MPEAKSINQFLKKLEWALAFGIQRSDGKAPWHSNERRLYRASTHLVEIDEDVAAEYWRSIRGVDPID